MASTPQCGVGTLSNYHDLSQIGEGMYGYVYKAIDSNGQRVALKRMIVHKEHLGFPLYAIREIKFLKQLMHKNIVILKDVITSKGCEHLDLAIKADSKAKIEQSKSQDKMLDLAKQEQSQNVDKNREKEMEEKVEQAIRQQREREYRSNILSHCGSLYLVFEYVEHDLGGLIDAKYQFSPRSLKCISKQIFEVLDYLAERKIIHRDIKCSNILISDRHHVKLADFGLARSAALPDGREGKIDMTNNVVTRWYKAPELLLGSTRYSYGVDVWSAGCVIAELFLERPLAPGRSELEQLELICRLLGSPSEKDWPGIVEMPYYEKMFKHAPKYTSTLRDVFANKVPDAALGLMDRIFVIDPTKRCSARSALNSKYFMTAPFAPDDPAELEPLQLTEGVSLHEYETKQRRRAKEKEDKQQADLLRSEDSQANKVFGASVTAPFLPPPPAPPRQITAPAMGGDSLWNNHYGHHQVSFGFTGNNNSGASQPISAHTGQAWTQAPKTESLGTASNATSIDGGYYRDVRPGDKRKR